MRRSAKPPKYGLHKATGQARVVINGEDHYLGPHGSPESLVEYNRLITEWLERQTEDLPPALRPLSITRLIDRYFEHCKKYYLNPDGSPTSELSCVRIALRPVLALYPDLPAKEFGPLCLKEVRKKFVAEGMVRKSLNRHVGRIKRMFRWAVSEQHVSVEVLTSLESVDGLRKGRSEAKESKKVKPAPPAAVEAVLKIVTRQVAAMIRLQLLCGCRPGEIIALRPCDIDRSGAVWIYRPTQHKGAWRDEDKEREIFLGPSAQQLLAPWLDRPADSFCFSPAEAMEEHRQQRKQNRKTPMTPSQRARQRSANPKRKARDRYAITSYERAIKKACEAAGVEPWKPNQLRHSRGTDIRKQYGLEAAQIILGHSKADVTQIYAERDREKAIEVMKDAG